MNPCSILCYLLSPRSHPYLTFNPQSPPPPPAVLSCHLCSAAPSNFTSLGSRDHRFPHVFFSHLSFLLSSPLRPHPTTPPALAVRIFTFFFPIFYSLLSLNSMYILSTDMNLLYMRGIITFRFEYWWSPGANYTRI